MSTSLEESQTALQIIAVTISNLLDPVISRAGMLKTFETAQIISPFKSHKEEHPLKHLSCHRYSAIMKASIKPRNSAQPRTMPYIEARKKSIVFYIPGRKCNANSEKECGSEKDSKQETEQTEKCFLSTLGKIVRSKLEQLSSKTKTSQSYDVSQEYTKNFAKPRRSASRELLDHIVKQNYKKTFFALKRK